MSWTENSSHASSNSINDITFPFLPLEKVETFFTHCNELNITCNALVKKSFGLKYHRNVNKQRTYPNKTKSEYYFARAYDDWHDFSMIVEAQGEIKLICVKVLAISS